MSAATLPKQEYWHEEESGKRLESCNSCREPIRRRLRIFESREGVVAELPLNKPLQDRAGWGADLESALKSLVSKVGGRILIAEIQPPQIG